MEFTERDLAYARSIVEQLEVPEYEFGGEDAADDIYEQVKRIVEHNDVVVNCGVSKVAIILKELPFVIKVPFDGVWDEVEDYETEIMTMEFSDFNYGGGTKYNDYCAIELDITNMAHEAGYDCFIPDMMFLCEVNGRRFYVQEKVKSLSESRREVNPTPDSYERAKRDRSDFDREWVALVYDFYGEDAWNEFVEWAENEASEILSDCHSGNYGIRNDGTPVIFDISGFDA